MKHGDHKPSAQGPMMPPPTVYLAEEDIRGSGKMEVGDTVTLLMKGHVAGMQEEGEDKSSKHLMLRIEISDVSVQEKNHVQQR